MWPIVTLKLLPDLASGENVECPRLGTLFAELVQKALLGGVIPGPASTIVLTSSAEIRRIYLLSVGIALRANHGCAMQECVRMTVRGCSAAPRRSWACPAVYVKRARRGIAMVVSARTIVMGCNAVSRPYWM